MYVNQFCHVHYCDEVRYSIVLLVLEIITTAIDGKQCCFLL